MDRFSQLLADWAKWFQHARGNSPVTTGKYLAYLERFARWIRGEDDSGLEASTRDPLCASRSDVETYIGLHAHKLAIKPQSRIAPLAALRSWFGWAQSKGHTPGNPAAEVPRPSLGRPLPRPISLALAEKVLMRPGIQTFVGLRDTAMLAVLISTGVRLSGLVGMTENSLVWFEVEGRERLAIRVVEKGKAERVVPTGREVATLMRAYMGHATFRQMDRDIAGDRVLWVTVGKRIPEHLYIGAQRQMSLRVFQEKLEAYCEQVGVPRGLRRAHAFRHLVGTELAESDVDVLQRQALLGHVRPETTAIYTQLATRKLMKTLDQASPLSKMGNGFLTDLRSLHSTLARARPPSSTA